ncbi:MAG: DUF4373 domain-containing protein [Clostridiales bacterium]|jgi:hypothetical protein|nr:DUF4373 domain-containing protein [Clostridiales bacterium]
MARPIKTGIDYFPCDVVFDEKVELIQAEFGIKAVGIIVRIWQEIYGTHGYYCSWDTDGAILFLYKHRLTSEGDKSLVSEIIRACVRRGIFDRDIFDKYQVLTSAGIQKRYLEAVSRRGNVKIKEEYHCFCNTQKSLLHAETKVNVDNKYTKTKVNVDNKYTKERREKKRKVKESVQEHTPLDIETQRLVDIEFSKSTFLRDTVKTDAQLQKLLPRILAGEFRDYKKKATHQSSMAIKNSVVKLMSSDELNSMFDGLDPTDM